MTEADERRGLRLGLEAEPPLRDLAERVAGALEERLRQRFPDIEWTVEVIDASVKDPQARITELVSQARQTMLDSGLDLRSASPRSPCASTDGR